MIDTLTTTDVAYGASKLMCSADQLSSVQPFFTLCEQDWIKDICASCLQGWCQDLIHFISNARHALFTWLNVRLKATPQQQPVAATRLGQMPNACKRFCTKFNGTENRAACSYLDAR